jgi:pilus assembly protein CpaF
VQRLRDGSRKVTHISEITGMEGDVVTMQDLFYFDFRAKTRTARSSAHRNPAACVPNSTTRRASSGLARNLLEVMGEAYGVC